MRKGNICPQMLPPRQTPVNTRVYGEVNSKKWGQKDEQGTEARRQEPQDGFEQEETERTEGLKPLMCANKPGRNWEQELNWLRVEGEYEKAKG